MFTLTKKDQEILMKAGYLIEDLAKIQAVMRVRDFVIFKDDNGKRVSREKVIKMLGRTDFLYGIGRAIFHWTTYKKDEKGKGINISARNLYNNKDEDKYDKYETEYNNFKLKVV